jgi:hypothetical protein
MTGTAPTAPGLALPGRGRWLLERRWDALTRPLPTRTLRVSAAAPADRPFDFSAAMSDLCDDIAGRCPELGHVDVGRLLVSFTTSRNRSRYGLQARVTPMRFRDGALTRRYRGHLYGVQRYYVGGREMLYLVTFCLPRFLDQSFEEKLVTVFHELFHPSPAFDGDLRRHPGRCEVHSHSKREYDRRMLGLVRPYLDGHPRPEVFDFLRPRAVELCRRHGGITGVVVPRPRLVPLSV